MRELDLLLARHGQEHLLRFWDELDEGERAHLAEDIGQIDLDLVDRLVATLLERGEPVDPGAIEAPEVVRPGPEDILTGRGALAAGEVAVVIVAGGQGTRLGFDGPKGCYPIGPVTDRSLFQIHAEKVVALGRRHGVSVPLYVMTSPQNHAATAAFFDEHDAFGVEHLRLFVQGEMPAVDKLTGQILLAERDRVALSPDGHGGTIRALDRSGALCRDGRRRDPHDLLPPGRQPAHRDRRPRLPRRPPPPRRRDVVEGRAQDRSGREGRPRRRPRRPPGDDRVLRPSRRARRAPRGRRRARALGRIDGAASHRARVRRTARGGGRQAAVPSRAEAGAVRRRARARLSSR